MASAPPSSHGRTDAQSVAISGALQLAKQVVVTQLKDIDPSVLDGIKKSFERLEEDALKACSPARPPPPPASDQLKQILSETKGLGKSFLGLPKNQGSRTVTQGGEKSFAGLEGNALEACSPARPPPPAASDQPKQILSETKGLGKSFLGLPKNQGSRTVSQGDEKSQPVQDESTAMKGKKRRGSWLDSSGDEEEAEPSMARDDAAPAPAGHEMVEETAKKRKIERRSPTKYDAVNEANLLTDENGEHIQEWDGDAVTFATRKPWMTAREEKAFFGRQSSERCSNCSELGHNIVDCTARESRCKRCGLAHRTLDCRSRECKCAVCGGPHHRGRRHCRAKEIEVLNEKLLLRYYSGDLP